MSEIKFHKANALPSPISQAHDGVWLIADGANNYKHYIITGGVVKELTVEGEDLTLEQARQNGNVLEGDIEFDSGYHRISQQSELSGEAWIDFSSTNRTIGIGSSWDYISKLTVSEDNISIYGQKKGLLGTDEFDKQGDRKAFAQLSDIYDYAIEKPTEGTAGQVLTTDGAGNYTWEDIDVEVEEQQFVQITEGGKTGWGLKYRVDNPDYYGDIGNNAIDLGYSENNSSITGATGDHSTVSGGARNTASGDHSTVSGGNNNYASGTASTVSGGNNNIAASYGEWVGGLFGTIPTGQNASTWVATDRLFNIGNGRTSYSRSDAFTILKNGLATLPSVTNTLIDAEPTGKAVVTKEWVEGAMPDYSSLTNQRHIKKVGSDLADSNIQDTAVGSEVLGRLDSTATLERRTIVTNASSLYTIDLNNPSGHYDIRLTGNTTIGFSNMITAIQSIVITLTVRGNYSLLFPSWLKPMPYNDDYHSSSVDSDLNLITIIIRHGGSSPSGLYSLTNVNIS